MRHPQQVVTHELAVLARQLLGHREPFFQRLFHQGGKRGIIHLLLRAVFQRVPIERRDVLAHLLVEAAPCLVAQPSALGKLGHPVRHAEVFAGACAQPLRHVEQHVETRDVRCAKGRALRAAEQRAGERVHFVDGEAGFHHALHGRDHAVHAQPVGNETRNILRDHDTLAEHHFAELSYSIDGFCRRIRRGNDLEEVQIPRRVEEVHAEEVLLELAAASVDEHLHWNAGGIRGDDRVRLAERLEPRVQRLLGRGLLDDGFEDQVAVAQEREVVVEIAERDERGACDVHECGGARLLRAFETGLGGEVPVAFGGGDVEQDDRDAGRRGERGDAAAHGSGADDAELRDAHGVRSGCGAGPTVYKSK